MSHLLALAMMGLLAGCAPMAWPPYGVAPAQGVVSACPPDVMAQARWVHENVTRLRLGGTRKEAVGMLGFPAHVESFLLADNSAVDVLFYHTPATACRPADAAWGRTEGLLPLVFQNDKLLGYGQGYYHNMVVPNLRQPLGLPLERKLPAASHLQPTTGQVGKGAPLR